MTRFQRNLLIKQNIKRHIKLILIQRYQQKIPSWKQFKRSKPNATQKGYRQMAQQIKNQNWYNQMIQDRLKRQMDNPMPKEQVPMSFRQYKAKNPQATQKDYIVHRQSTKQKNWWRKHWYDKAQEYKNNMRKQNRQNQEVSANIRSNIKQITQGLIQSFVKSMKQDGVGRVAGYNGPRTVKPIKQDRYGNFPQMNHQVANSKGQGINKKGRQRSFQKQTSNQAVQFDNQGQTFTLNDPNEQYYQERPQGQFAKLSDFPSDQYSDQMIGAVDGRQERRYLRAIRNAQVEEQQQVERMFAERRSQQYMQPSPLKIDASTPPRPGEQRVMHSGRQQRQRNWCVPQSKTSKKPIIKQGTDIQQLYDNMERFMLEVPEQKLNLRQRVTGGKDPGYDVC